MHKMREITRLATMLKEIEQYATLQFPMVVYIFKLSCKRCYIFQNILFKVFRSIVKVRRISFIPKKFQFIISYANSDIIY